MAKKMSKIEAMELVYAVALTRAKFLREPDCGDFDGGDALDALDTALEVMAKELELLKAWDVIVSRFAALVEELK